MLGSLVGLGLIRLVPRRAVFGVGFLALLELGFVFASIPVSANHDPNDFFVLEALFPGVVWEAIHGVAGSDTSVWAVGNQGTVPFVAKRTSGAWVQDATFPASFAGPARDVFVVTASDVWVVGGPQTTTIVDQGSNIARWDGAAWTVSSLPGSPSAQTPTSLGMGQINNVWAVSATDVWIAGNQQTQTGSVTVRARIAFWDGATWTKTFTAGLGSGIDQSHGSQLGGGGLWLPSHAVGFTIYGSGSIVASQGFRRSGADWGLNFQDGLSLPVDNPEVHGVSLTSAFVVGGDSVAPPTPTNSKIIGWDGTTWAQVSSPTMNHLRGVWGITASDYWAVGDVGTIIHNAGSGWTLEPTTTTNNLNAVYGSSASLVWIVSDQGEIFKLQVNAATPPPSLAAHDYNHDNIFVSASQAQCLGDETSFSVNLEPPGAGVINNLEAYILNSDTNVVVEVIPMASFYNLGGEFFHTSRPYPAGDYQFLVLADFTLLPDAFMGVSFNVPTGSCFTAAERQDLIDRLNDLRGDIITEISNANSTASQGGLLALGAFPGYTLGETTVIVLGLGLMLWAMYQGYFLMAFGSLLFMFMPIMEAFDGTVENFENGFLITFTLLLLFVWLEALVRGWRLRKANALAEKG